MGAVWEEEFQQSSGGCQVLPCEVAWEAAGPCLEGNGVETSNKKQTYVFRGARR